jgi:hypothetical protein
MTISREIFEVQFNQFRDLVQRYSGREFVSFSEGTPHEWESYKPKIRETALNILQAGHWEDHEIGSGQILEQVIDAIEISNSQTRLRNNLVRWENRYGHANRSHRALLDAREDTSAVLQFESWFVSFYQNQVEDGDAFDQFTELAGKRYDLIAYLFFLRDMDRFMPIAPTHFDQAFELLGLDLITAHKCSWDNYLKFNGALVDVQNALRDQAGLSDVRLIDAHSFCWMLVDLEKEIERGSSARPSVGPNQKEPGKIYDSRAKSVYEMADSTENTVKHAQGQTVHQTVKIKNLKMSRLELEGYITDLLVKQENKCALTGIPLQYRGEQNDDQLLPSLDRIDSDGHYDKGNLQVVCRFINFWKSSSPDDEFRRLLSLVRGEED